MDSGLTLRAPGNDEESVRPRSLHCLRASLVRHAILVPGSAAATGSERLNSSAMMTAISAQNADLLEFLRRTHAAGAGHSCILSQILHITFVVTVAIRDSINSVR
jgi:hypothetical protein